ncbi:MAG: hypothetical protein H6540_04395 [Bacteroidales bacterium]|nr:hypothetical protein [Bacteroidales bacterium]
MEAFHKENPTYTYFDAGTYPIALTVQRTWRNATKTTLEVYATPILNFSYTPDSVYVNDKRLSSSTCPGYAKKLWNSEIVMILIQVIVGKDNIPPDSNLYISIILRMEGRNPYPDGMITVRIP